MSRVTGYGIVCLLLLGAAPLWAGADDCASGPGGDLVQHSAFAHGYLHGYEAGFHAGDGDFHIAYVRTPRELREIDRPSGYRSEFGPRESYRGGFRQGFLVGYQDSIAGRDFRGFKNLTSLVPSGAAPEDFDHGFEDGYTTGQRSGIDDLDADGDFDPEKAACPAKPDADGHMPESSQAYCAGYMSAYRAGYTDGYLMASPAGGEDVVAAK